MDAPDDNCLLLVPYVDFDYLQATLSLEDVSKFLQCSVWNFSCWGIPTHPTLSAPGGGGPGYADPRGLVLDGARALP